MGEIRKHTKSDNIAISHFLEQYFPRRQGIIERRSRRPEYYEWKYDQNPFGESMVYHYWENGELVGTFGAIAKPLSIRGRKLLAYQRVDAFVAPHLQGKGIYRQLADLVFNEIDKRAKISYGMDAMKVNLAALTQRFGCYVPFCIRHAFSPIRFDDVLRASKLSMVAHLGMPANVLKRAFFRFPKIDVHEIDDIPSEFYADPDENIDLSTVRDVNYLRYRYLDSPEPYRLFAVRSDTISAVLVLKFVLWRGTSICCLVDVLSRLNVGKLWIFLSQALSVIGTKTKTALVSLEVPEEETVFAGLRRHGFLVRRRNMPIDVRQKEWPFLLPTSPEFNKSRWVILPGDSDVM